MNRRIIAFLLGHILLLEAAVMVPALVISLVMRERSSAHAFGWAIAITAIVGFGLTFVRPTNKVFYAAEGFVVTALSWIGISLFGALPFWFSGAIPNYIDCFFETASGFTTTGASILTNVEALPYGLLYWRSFTHWLGGMGVLVFLLAVVSVSKGAGYSLHLLRAESPGPDVGKMTPKLKQSAKILYIIYICLTVIEIILLLAGGMPVFDSLCTAFGTAGTGGFGIKNDSITSYSHYIQTVVTIFMALFGLNFNVYFLLLAGKPKEILQKSEVKVYLLLIFASISTIFFFVRGFYDSVKETLINTAFTVGAFFTSTGFCLTDFDAWPLYPKVILTLLMIIGACAGSTCGSMKISRVIILVKVAYANLRRLVSPRSVKSIKMDGKRIESETIADVNAFVTLYIFIMIISVILVSLDGQNITTTGSAVVSTLNNIGIGFDGVGASGNFSIFSSFSKLVMCFDMLAGRLEIFPLIILLMPRTWRRQ